MTQRHRYREIAQALHTDIDAGIHKPGEVLPSSRNLAEQWGVSRGVVTQALGTLVDAGVIISVPAEGTKSPPATKPHSEPPRPAPTSSSSAATQAAAKAN
ncbi:hypothetical protein GCM10020255_027040 [Rhodococcus baikonurensis]